MFKYPQVCSVALSVSVWLVACSSGAFDPIGRWNSRDGYVVSLRQDNTYEFCDRNWCSHGIIKRSGNPGGIAITLVGFFNKDNSARMAERLRRLHEGYPVYAQSDDLDFTANSGVGSAGASKFCDWKPCVIYGNVEEGPNLVFTKIES
jgi:hypothetical protein